MDRNQRNLILRTAKISVEILVGIVGIETINRIKGQITYESVKPEGFPPKQWQNLVFMSTLTQCIFEQPYDSRDILTVGCYRVMIQALYNQNRNRILQNWLTDGDHALCGLYARLVTEVTECP
jgi:hypothetical protein